MSIYYTGKYLNPIPTGFGGYTGLLIQNSGNFTVVYTAEISDTTLLNLPSSSIINGSDTNTLFISNKTTIDDLSINTATLTLAPSESGVFYILNRPFTYFTQGNGVIGNEKATITIQSLSDAGDSDLPIVIDVTGQRVFDNPIPTRIGKFYAVKSYSEENEYQITFHWNTLSPVNYIKKFELDLYSDSSFSTPVTNYSYDISHNNDSTKPLYGDYNGFVKENYYLTISSLDIAQDYYARIRGVNFENEAGPYSYPTGYSTPNPILTLTGISGLYPSPGDNLKSDASVLNLIKNDDYVENFNVYDFMKKNNNNSADFRFYSGVRLKLSSMNNSIADYVATTVLSGGLNFVVPSSDNFRFSSNNNVFTIELELNNISVLGRGGKGLEWKSDGVFVNAKDGGPCFNFDKYTYNGQSVEFRIYKDLNSTFFGGLGGGKGWAITDESTNNNNVVNIDGGELEYFRG